MIQPLRRAHRFTFTVLAFALPVVLAVGLGARRPQRAESVSIPDLPNSTYLIQRSNRLWQKHAIVTEFYGDSTDMQTFYVVLKPQSAVNEPDLLLYWSFAELSGDALPPGAQLIAVFTPGKALPLHVGGERSGRLILYSGAHQTAVDTTLVERLP